MKGRRWPPGPCWQPGRIRMAGLQLEGVSIPHGPSRRPPLRQARSWRWKQGGLEFPHLGAPPAGLRPGRDRVLWVALMWLRESVWAAAAKCTPVRKRAEVVRELPAPPGDPGAITFLGEGGGPGREPQPLPNAIRAACQPFPMRWPAPPCKRVGRSFSFGQR